jgi:CHAT domain-containing protein
VASRQLRIFPVFLTLAVACGLGGACKRTTPETTLDKLRGEMRQGKYADALRDVDAALSTYQKKDARWAARFRVVKARILMARGAYSDSLRLLREPLPKELAGTDTEVEQKMVEGLDFSYLQDLRHADEALSQAENLSSKFDSSLSGAVAQSRGMLEVDRKNYENAIAAFLRAATYGREHKQPRAELDALGNLGNVAMFQEHYDEAVDRFNAALEKSRALSAKDAESRALGNLGWSYSVVGDFDNAEISFRDAEIAAGQAGLVEDQTYWLISLAEVYAQQRRYGEGKATAERALALAEQHDDKSTLTTCLNTLSQIALATGGLDDAAKYNRRATDIENAGLDHFGIRYSQLIAGRIAMARGNFDEALASFRKVLSDAGAETPLLWEAHARSAQALAGQQRPAEAEHEFQVAIRTLREAQAAVESNEFRLSFLSTAIEFYDAYVNFLIERKRPGDALKIADLSRSQTLEQRLVSGAAKRSSKGRQSAEPELIARRLDTTLLFYWVGTEKSWLWAITPVKTTLIAMPPSGSIDPLVREYRESFNEPRNPVDDPKSAGRALYDLLLRPAEKYLDKGVRLAILPDGSLNSLNFETLIVPGHDPGGASHYFIEDATIVTANSLKLLARAAETKTPQEKRLLVMGEALPASPDFPPLPDAEREVGILEKYFAASQRVELIGARATATDFLSSGPEQFGFLHFATHGTASRLRPLESAVILSPQGGAYKLYARDIVTRKLKAQLVTISACNGAGTKSYAGEGLVGLSWAFLSAGAHNVIAGLWEVSNASTPQLMDELYRRIIAGEEPASALREAKLSLVRSNGTYRRPFYWAPFLLYAGS